MEVPRNMLSEPEAIAVMSAPYTVLEDLPRSYCAPRGSSDLKEWPWRYVISFVRCFDWGDGKEVERFPL